MMVETKLPSTADRNDAYAARLAAEPLPSVVLNCLTSEIVAANAAGFSALGLATSIQLPHALDSAMPAISVVRALANDGLIAAAHRTLIFWRNGRAVPMPCRIARTDIDSAAPITTHATIIFEAAQTPVSVVLNSAAQVHHAKPGDSVIEYDDSPPRIVRDDNETLKEIARRILEAQKPASTSFIAVSKNEPIVQKIASDGALANASAFPPSPQPAANVHPLLRMQTDVPHSASSLAPSDIAKLAHELKTPLTAIAAAAEIMRDERLGEMGNEKYLGYAADIHSSAAHALAVIQNMLALPATATAPASTSFTAFDVSELARTTVSSMQPLAQQRQLALTLDAELDLTPIRANATAIRQILLNLLTNALKFTPPGGEVRVVTGYLNDGAVFMVVRDTGDGIDQATLDRVLDNTPDTGPEAFTVRAGGGRGIGLKLVRRLAAENGAEFEIESVSGKGTLVMLAFAKDLVGPLR